MRLLRVILWLSCLLTSTFADNNDTQPISIFRSRPDLVAPILSVFIQDRAKQAPGYWFVAPYQQIQESVHIYDDDANLIYSGFGSIGPGICHAPQTCMYKGEIHLCFYQGTQMTGWGHGHGVIMDKHYRVVKSVEPGSYQASSDMHEFQLIEDGKSALMSQYLRSPYDLCQWDLCDGLGYIQIGAFQEVDVETGAVNFEWRSLDHVDPSESYVQPSTTEISGSGEHPDSPWDYFHINSIDKNAEGDYLVSARHVSCIYKISGKDGHIIWRLNGAKSDYYLANFTFSFQHDAQFVSDNADETIISLFDNGSNGFNVTQRYSTGQIIKLDHKTKIATAILNLAPPLINGNRHSSKSQGNLQQLPNGNIVLGWGNDAFWTEYAPLPPPPPSSPPPPEPVSAANSTNTTDNTPETEPPPTHEIVFYANIGWENVMNYRVHKFNNWIGLPLTKPALWTYSKTGYEGEGMVMYVSWNGATEVRYWRFYTSTSRQGPWVLAMGEGGVGGGVVNKTGFETMFEYERSALWTYAEALDGRMRVLGESAVQLTFTPTEALRGFCDGWGCGSMPDWEERQREKEEKKEKEAEEERLRVEQEEERLREEEEEEERRRVMRKRLAYGGGFSALVLIGVVLAVLGTKNVVSRNVSRGLGRVWDGVVSKNGTRRKTRKDARDVGYTALALEDQDGDEGEEGMGVRAPMIRDGS